MIFGCEMYDLWLPSQDHTSETNPLFGSDSWLGNAKN